MAERVDLTVYYYSDAGVYGGFDVEFGQKVIWDVPMLSGYNYVFLPNRSKSVSMANRMLDAINPSAFNVIRKSDAEIVVINGWKYLTNYFVIISAKCFGKEVWLRAETPSNQVDWKGSRGRLVNFFLGRILFRYFIDRFLFIGTLNKEFYQKLGVAENRLIYTPYAVDNDRFSAIYEEGKGRKNEFRDKLGLPLDKKIVLYSGKLIDKKRPMDLLEAFADGDFSDAFLVFMGDGELRPVLEEFIAENGMDNVLITGFVNQSKVPEYYLVADLFVMCSGIGETWGLSANEAMNFGLPVLISDTVGSSVDLVEPGKNGFVFREGSVVDLKEKLQMMLGDRRELEDYGRASKEIVEKFSILTIVDNIEKEIGPKVN